MYYLYTDYGLETEQLIWKGASLVVGMQHFNRERSASDKYDFETLELFRLKDDGDRFVEKTFRFPA